MGLAGAKNRTKISKDPNNNNWAKNTSSFGHKILSSQGWKPGQYLGATDAAHQDHYTQANASHIRVLLRDDNLGLGAAKAGARNAETFGLLQFSGLLGRLNGKDAGVLAKEEETKRDVQLKIWQGQKYGTMNFVSAGFLVGDKIEERPKALDGPAAALQSSKKRKRGDGDGEKASVSTSPATPQPPATREPIPAVPAAKKTKKSKKSKSADANATIATTSSNSDTDKPDKAARRARKAARRQAKQERAERKEAKRKARMAKAERKANSDPPTPPTASDDDDSDDDEKEVAAVEPVSTPASLSTIPESAPAIASPAPDLSRFAVRRRYIQQKRMAGMDPQAMKEIFMIKSA